MVGDRGERVDAGGRLGGPELLAGRGRESVDFPVKSEVKTTSLATVAAPKSGCGSAFCHFTLPVAASNAVSPPVALANALPGTENAVAEACAHRFSQGTKSVPLACAIGVSIPPKSPGRP